MITVGIIDDHPISRWGMQRALEPADDILIAGTYATPAAATDPVEVILIDLFLADDTPCFAEITAFANTSAVLVVSASRRQADVNAALRAGARGYLHKGSAPEKFVEAVRAAAAGHPVPPASETELGKELGSPPPLSVRERQVLHLVAAGYTHEQVARRLCISRHTVDTYVKRLRAKVGMGNKAYLTQVAVALGAGPGDE